MAIGDLVLGVRICALRILGRLSERHQRPGGHDVVFDGLSSLLGELLNEASRTRHIACADSLRRSYPAIISGDHIRRSYPAIIPGDHIRRLFGGLYARR